MAVQERRSAGRPKRIMDNLHRIRRDVANDHERRRMQSINDGIQELRRILPHKDMERLSKSTILLRSAEYLMHLETQLSFVKEENNRLNSLAKHVLHEKLKTSLTEQQTICCQQSSQQDTNFDHDNFLNKSNVYDDSSDEENEHGHENGMYDSSCDDNMQAIDLSIKK